MSLITNRWSPHRLYNKCKATTLLPSTSQFHRHSSTMISSPQKPVLISGAGLASLLLAQSLRHSGIPFHIYERDASISTRAQGYRLRLSTEGLDAIESVLPPDQWKAFWAACGKTGGSNGGLTVLNAVTAEDITEDKSRPVDQETKSGQNSLTSRDGLVIGIARGEMRNRFAKGCEDSIHFSHQITGYESTATGVHALFADGTKSPEGSLLVGGEGIYSKVAKQLSAGALKVFDTGARGIHGQAPTSAFKGLGEGVWRIVDETRPDGKVFIITNVRPDAKDDPDVMLGWTLGGQPGVIEAPGGNYAVVGKVAADLAKELTKNWHPSLRPLFEQMDVGEAAFWKITCSTPRGVPEWKNDPRVTVIGDAVHSMTPAGGIGANTAVRDSALLGRLLREAGGWGEHVTGEYEKKMRVYGSEAVGKSYGMASGMFGVKLDENSPTV